MKEHTVFLRKGLILPDRFDLREEPLCANWTEVVDAASTELDARVRKAGWHFMWMAGAHSYRAMGSTAKTAIDRALFRGLKAMNARCNAAEAVSIQTTSCLGFQIAKVTLEARQIQRRTSLDAAVERQFKHLPAH